MRVPLAVRRGERGFAGYGCANWIADVHLGPVVTKLLAAIQTYDIGGVALAGCRRETSSPRGSDREGRPAVRATHQKIHQII